MKSYLLLGVAVALLSGCTTVGGTRALATPWGAAGLYSFKDKPALAGEPSERKVDVQVAKALDSYEQTTGDADVRVAAAEAPNR